MNSFGVFGMIATLLTAFAVSACGSGSGYREPSIATQMNSLTVTNPDKTPNADFDNESAGFPVIVHDSNGNVVIFARPPERIVAIDSAAVEILFAIGAGWRIVATHDFLVYPPEARDIETVGDAFNLNIEKVLELEPDLVFIFYKGPMDVLENTGQKVLYLESLSNDFVAVAANVRLWGRIVDEDERAEDVANEFTARIQAIHEEMANLDYGPSIFWDTGGFWTAGADTLVGEVLQLLKLRNIAGDVKGYAQLSPEQIVERNPDIIVTLDSEQYLENQAFKRLSAVKNAKVFTLPFNPGDDPLSVGSPRVVDGIEALARIVYPDRFY